MNTPLPTTSLGNLAKDILEGTLCLETTQPVAPQRFGFSIGETCVGLYSAVSVEPGVLALTRAWNVLDSTWDVFRKMWIPVEKTKKFSLLRPQKALFLVSLALDSDEITDKVAFTMAHITPMYLARGDIKFERAILSGIEILG